MAKKSYPSREERMKDLNQRLEQGIRDVFESERFRDYLAVMSRFHTYSARNVLLIHMQRPNATRVASAKRWKEQFERFINKGEKAIYIMAPIPIVKTVERQKLDPDTKAPVLDEDGQVITEKREVQVPRFRPVPVFDVSQTNGKPLPQLAQDLTGDVEQYEAFMEALRRTAPVPMEIKPMAENLDGYFSLDEQSISIRAGMSEVQTVCAAVHEITHSILHNQRGVREDKAVRTAQELEAESVSYVVCQYCGVETGANSFGYLASWSKDKELSELRACLATINKTANQLIGEIDRHFAEVCKERGIELEQENAPKISANFEGLDTPEQFAAALYDYMAELEAAGMLQHPYSLDPREQAIVEIMEELRAGHFADIRNTLDRVGEQTGLPTAVAMLDRLEKLSDIRDQGLTFRLEANPNATSYQDQGYLQAGEWNGDSYIPREVIYVGPTDRCRELLYQLEAGDMTARQVRALDQTDSKELEALYLLDDAAYLHIQLRDEGYDYTLYDKETMRLRDGGVIDAEDVALSPIKHPLAAVREEVFDTMGERPEKVEAVPLELGEKLQEAQLEPPAVSSREKLIEHFAAEDAVLFDTELDTYPMPDPSMSMEHLTEAGYTENDLLPLSLDTAELMYAALQAQRELPVYRYPGGYAHEHGELEQYRASRKADIACKEAIESAITEHYRDNCLGREAVSQVVEQFGYERVLHVLANTVRHKEWDGRISQGNKAWARTVPVFEDLDAWGNDRNKEFVVDRSHPGIIDLFVDMVRHEYLLTQPLTKDDIRAEAARILSAFQAARGPNSPSGTHFMVQVSPDFLARANSKNQNRLVSMLPFRSLSISTLEGRKGVYALITKDEDRAQSLRLRKPSVRKKLSETKAEPGHTDKKKVREQER